ncbi:hypothetical protein KY284_029994 [Solanum tuberosum]|nr:hypothetical protein KY284_029994 [Solanum tuberosum]
MEASIQQFGGGGISVNEESLGIILGVPSLWIRSIEGCKPSSDFVQRATKRGDIKHVGLPKQFLRGEYQLLFEFINKVLVPMSEKRTVASAADLFHMEQLDELEAINLPATMLEYMHRVMTWKNARHGIPYEYLLNYVFEHFGVAFGRGVPGTVKHMFSPATLLECKCAEGKVKGKSYVFDLLEHSVGQEKVDKLKAENAQLLKTNASLSEEVQALNKKLLQAHVDANNRMTLLLRSLLPHLLAF